MRVGVEAMLEEDLGIGGFAAADEENEVMLPGKRAQVFHAVGDIAADRVIDLHVALGARPNSGGEGMVVLDGHGRLGEEEDRARKVEGREIKNRGGSIGRGYRSVR